MPSPCQLLVVGPLPDGLADTRWGRCETSACADLDRARERLADGGVDALLLNLPGQTSSVRGWSALSQAVLDAAVVVLVDDAEPAQAAALIETGVQDVLPAVSSADALARALHLAVLRHRAAREALRGQAIDLATGLPNQAQLLDHMSHLLALREREPAPMALLVIRIEGLATTEATLGVEAAGVLRRKLAVRLRASLRSSDVVAAVGADAFAALLAWIDAPAAAERVGAKLVKALQRPLRVGERELAVAVSLGVAHHPGPADGAPAMLRQALASAAGMTALGREGYSNRLERGATGAANDDSA